MRCKHSDNCTYYKTNKYKASSKQHQLLIESYCEGELQPKCRRMQHEAEFNKKAPEGLAPNGYLVGTHKKLRVENTRKFKRHTVKDSLCLLQALDSARTFSAWVVDVSEGGMRLELNIDPNELKICPGKTQIKILGYSAEDIPIPITKDVIKMVWQNKQFLGCCFADPLLAL